MGTHGPVALCGRRGEVWGAEQGVGERKGGGGEGCRGLSTLGGTHDVWGRSLMSFILSLLFFIRAWECCVLSERACVRAFFQGFWELPPLHLFRF